VKVPALAVDAGAFAPYGTLIEMPAVTGERRLYTEWLAPSASRGLQFHTNRVARSHLPVTVERVERHPHASQVFVPLRVTRYLVTVMDALPDGAPDPASVRAFIVPGTVGVAYREGVWHASMTVLDEEASFAVFMWRGQPDDDVFAAIPPLVVVDSDPGHAGGTHD
jgi:ureidoglycolate lyase